VVKKPSQLMASKGTDEKARRFRTA